MRFRILLLLLFSVFLTSSQILAQLYTFKNYNYKDGQNITNFTCFAQTRDGLLWFGSYNSGVVNFNGKKFTDIPFKKSSNKHHITSITRSDNDVIYCSSKYNGFYKLQGTQFELFYKNQRNVGNYLGIYPFGKSILLICEKSILISQNGKIVNRENIRSTNKKIKISQFIQAPDGAIVLTDKGGYFISSADNKITQLHKYLSISEKTLSTLKFGHATKQKVIFFSQELNKKLEVLYSTKGKIWSKIEQNLLSPLPKNEQITASTFDAKHNRFLFISQQGTIYYFANEHFGTITQNCTEKLVNCNNIMTDIYGDLWVSSSLKGIYKVSLEPFTKIELNPVYQNSLVSLIFQSKKGQTFISNESGQTNISQKNSSDFTVFNFNSTSACELGENIYLGTSEGLKTYNSTTNILSPINIEEIKNKKIQFVFSDDHTIWMGIRGEGLYRYNPITHKTTVCQNLYSTFPRDFYTAQKTYDGKLILFGSKNGIHQFNSKIKTFTHIDDFPKELGTYSGLSTIDIYGTRWFTLEKGLVGFTKNNRRKIIQDIKKLVTTNFHTLNSDQHGNLIVGTNLGITVLKLNKNGTVLSSNTYNSKSGFTGYETRIGTQYQTGNNIYVGTIEGIYLINTNVLKNLPRPSKPTLVRFYENDKISAKKQNFNEITFHVNNPKIDNIQYRYRLVGVSNIWSESTSDTSVIYSDLASGSYLFEVKATFDGNHFSNVSAINLQVINTFWTSNIFIISIIILFALLNIYLLNKIKSFDTKTIFSNKDNTITTKLIPRIILIAAIINSVSHFSGYMLDKSIPVYTSLLLLSIGAIVFIYILSIFTTKQNNGLATKTLLIIGFSILLLQNFTELYLSSLHPYFIIIIGVLSTLIPFIFGKLRSSIIFSICILLLSCLCFIFPTDVHFNKYLFITIMILIVCLSIFTTYLRHDSISKLLFISGVINKGNVLTVAINEFNQITYVSENIAYFFKAHHEEILNKNISILSNYLPLDSESDFYTVAKFQDGKKYLIPMTSIKNEIIWIEWSCKIFSSDVKVILGQDVTKKMELETTFELLVQNAEDFIYQCNLNGNFVFLNKQSISRVGYSKKELIGKNSKIIIAEKDQEEVEMLYKNHFVSGQDSSYFEFPIITKSGEKIWLGQHTTSLYEPGSTSKIRGFLAVARDITEKRKQQKIIEEQQRDITSSIHYAKRIQLNLLPNRNQFDKSFEESAVFFKPKDIVSGDFYWMEKINHFTIFALGDCTGHGVPGSFMTLLGINLLNSIVLENQTTSPREILNQLDEKLRKVLPRGLGDNKVNDGMEITVCSFNHETNQLIYACAGSRFIIYKDGVFTVCKINNKHIGDSRDSFVNGYDEQSLILNKDDIVYLLTDGFQDQFGGERNKKFNFKRILTILEANIDQSLEDQRNRLEIEFSDWKGDYEQTDDVAFIALKGLTT